MACDLATGRLAPCKDALAGLRAIYFINKDDMTGVSYDATNTDVIESVTGTPVAYKFDLRGASTFEQTIQTSKDTGTTVFEQVLNVTLTKQDLATHKQVKLLAYSNPTILVRDNNDNIFMMGLKFGADMTGGSITSGNAMNDLNGYTLTFTAMEPKPANFLEATSDTALGTAGFTVTLGA